MRWPIQVQLLATMLGVLLVAIGLATGSVAYVSYRHARRVQEENLRRTVRTLLESAFPLTERVLEQMSGLSGAEYLLLDDLGRIRAGTLPLPPAALQTVRAFPLAQGIDSLDARDRVQVGEEIYVGCRIRVPVRFGTDPPGSLVVLYREDRWTAEARRAVWPSVLAGGGAALLGSLAAVMLARRIVQPLRQLCQRSESIANGQLEPMPVPSRNDELRDLVVSINRMCEQLRAYEVQVRQHERLRTLDQLSAGIAHQLRNAATGARMAIELHQRLCSNSAQEDSLQMALGQLQQMESYLQRFLTASHQTAATLEVVDLAQVVMEAVELVRPACMHAHVPVEVSSLTNGMRVRAQKQMLREVVVNLLWNALWAVQRQAGGGRIELKLFLRPPTEGQQRQAVLEVLDTGPGPSTAVRDRLFEPFVTDKPEGAGLGLFMAQRVIRAFGGQIGWRRENGMTCFFVQLPLYQQETEHGPSADRG
ncbi:MAG: HAMP domain-containing histidine kinase [Thermoguttaceae bacterium]|nr:HAMP domain-containing histidine kinase [Thermoguttaceae bacterium]MDW8039324.1 HAMP domain-containing sensor histidine kinase [Thermoguttaceae bacterium]